MKVRADSDVPGAFVVDAKGIKQLWEHAEEFTSATSATVKCADDVTRKFNTIESLLAFDNPKRASIQTLSIEGYSHERERNVAITMGRGYSSSASFVVNGEELDVSHVKTKVSDTIFGMKAWYGWLATIDSAAALLAISLLLVVTGMLMSAPGTQKIVIPPEKKLYLTVVLLGLMATIALAIWATWWFRRRFFPVFTFAIGQGVTRHQFDEQIRWVVIVGFFVSVAASIFMMLPFAG
jgi:hypothetical protein